MHARDADAGGLSGSPGTEFSFTWTIVLDTVDGTIGVTLVNRENALVLFGACTAM
jgi:hypothetical protein